MRYKTLKVRFVDTSTNLLYTTNLLYLRRLDKSKTRRDIDYNYVPTSPRLR